MGGQRLNRENSGTGSDSLARWRQELSDHLRKRADRGLLRKLEFRHDLVDFASNDYLSLNSSGRLQEILREEALRWSDGNAWNARVGSTGSRLVTGHHKIFEDAEEAFARFAGYESALFFNSGYAANTGAIPALMGPGDIVLCDRLSHASLLDGIRLSGAKRRYFRHNDLNDLEHLLIAGSSGGRTWIVTETLFSMDGDSPDLAALVDLAERYDALLYIDEAHALGVYGEKGAGLASQRGRRGIPAEQAIPVGREIMKGVQDRVAVAVFPLGKAPGLAGAFVCGPAVLKEYLIQHARSFVFSTAMPPIFARLVLRVIELFLSQEGETLRNRLRDNVGLFHSLLQGAGLPKGDSNSQIIPVIVGEAERALEISHLCEKEGLDVRPIRPPTVPPGTSRLRVNIHAGNSVGELERLAALLMREMG